jgi:uncharacterized protein
VIVPVASFLDLAYEVLKTSDKPLTYQEIWDQAVSAGISAELKSTGKTPWQSLGSRLYVDVRDNKKSRFLKVGRPARFFLSSKKDSLTKDLLDKLDREERKTPEKALTFHERDLHPLLNYFVYANPTFNHGRPIFTKTIFHEKSTKTGYTEWTHPDIVGFSLPVDDWNPEVMELNRLSDNDSLRMFSFEMKKSLTKANYREAYFQAVSNSSWAHEGYLVAADVFQEDDFRAELERLASSFGIGIIHIDPTDIDGSTILYPARRRSVLDWETINKLSEQNDDFRTFLRDVKIDFDSKKIHASEYDPLQKDIGKYIETVLGVKGAS